MFSDLSPNQAKAFVDAEQGYRAHRDAQEKMHPYKGGMHWKHIAGKQYLYRTLDSKGTAKSLGPRSEETEALHSSFRQRRSELEHRLVSLDARVQEQTRMARALRVGAAPRVLAGVCRALCEHGLMGRNVLIIGTNALYAYEALAGVRLQSDVTATQDMDVLFKHKLRLKAVARNMGPEGFLGVLKTVDKSFEISATQPFRAINADGYMVDLIRQTPTPPWKSEPHNLGARDAFVAADIPNMKWMLSAPSLRQFVLADNGTPFEMEVPDPRAFMLFKSWLSMQADRDPVKRPRDALQARLLSALLRERLAQFPMDGPSMKTFPKVLVESSYAAPIDPRPGPSTQAKPNATRSSGRIRGTHPSART
ncbi:hypothetical protein D5041_20070 [Verminephrobacter aporrectodeae subsp. tuberculatae]|uniref:nucleotidyltransferase domain-containing protein n=1 Tax=Verminephrobacter aporrectodeae TaxID=1110389 RepID=UPI002237EF88|nr:nucleotidyltransferase domain-containing protein [Verminephrobacter aporrectodeae]MCW5221948.1 hypothetical protein [Verminephrobacter aporrectodeae subsp. tuberculatae]MCW5291239.1 hypothetical protein [Verminephrobacter aporrectodeae subsp. tuberculatae]